MNPKIKTAKSLSAEAISQLHKYQTGEDKVVLTGRPYIDKHLKALLPGDVITIFAPSGVGKTEEFSKIFRKFLSEEVNPDAKNYVSLEFNLEMQYFNLFLRDSAKNFGKKKSDILLKEFTEEEKSLIKEYHNALSDNRRFIVEETVTTKELFEIMEEFCEEHKDKSAILCGIDHVGLILSSEKGEDPLERITTYINILKKKYKNVYFLLLTQMNRSYYSQEPKERSNNNVPTTSMIYGASHFEFLSSYIVAIVNPFKTFGIREYRKVKPDRYPDLSDFVTYEDKKGFVSFDTIGNLFFEILKLRDSDYMFDTLYIERMGISKEQLEKMKQSVETTEAPTFEIPTFAPEPNFDIDGAFG
jgi:hypothetical protein